MTEDSDGDPGTRTSGRSRWRDRSSLTRRSRWGWLIFGCVFGVVVSALTTALPGSPPVTRIQSLWVPAYRDLHSAAVALDVNQFAAAHASMERALTESGPARYDAVLDWIVEACAKRQQWTLAREYAWQALVRRGRPLDQARYAETLIGLSRPGEAALYLQSALVGVAATRATPDLQPIIDGDLAIALIRDNRDLDRALFLADNGIRMAATRRLPGELQAALNDVLAQWYYHRALSDGESIRAPSLEMARIQAETARDDLEDGARPSIRARVYFHLGAIYAAEGRASASNEALRVAARADLRTYDWLQAHPMAPGRSDGSAPVRLNRLRAVPREVSGPASRAKGDDKSPGVVRENQPPPEGSR